MKRKALTMLLALTLVFSIVGVSLAEFDFSVFEDYEQYEFDVEFDPMDDTGTIGVPTELDPFPNVTSSSSLGLDILGLDIRTASPGLTILRMNFFVVGTWTNAEKIIFLPDKTRYTIDALSTTDYIGTTKTDTVVTVVMPKLLPMFEEIIEKKITSVTYRLDGKEDINGTITVNTENLKTILDLFKSAGGWNQNYTIIETAFSVTVK